jgi:hypothetical protein
MAPHNRWCLNINFPSIGLLIVFGVGFLAGCVPGLGGAGIPPTITASIIPKRTATSLATETPFPTLTFTLQPSPTLEPTITPTSTTEASTTPNIQSAWEKALELHGGKFDFQDRANFPDINVDNISYLVRQKPGDPEPAYIAWLRIKGILGAPWPKDTKPLKLGIVKDTKFDFSVVKVSFDDMYRDKLRPVRVVAPWRMTLDDTHHFIGFIQEYYDQTQNGKDASFYMIFAVWEENWTNQDSHRLAWYQDTVLGGFNRGDMYCMTANQFPESPHGDLAIFPWWYSMLSYAGFVYNRPEVDTEISDWVIKNKTPNPDQIYFPYYGEK